MASCSRKARRLQTTVGRQPDATPRSELPGISERDPVTQHDQLRQGGRPEQLIVWGRGLGGARVVREEQAVRRGGEQAANADAHERPLVGRSVAARVSYAVIIGGKANHRAAEG